MKAQISSKGVLTVTATSEVEEYALRQWWNNFNEGDHSSMLSVIYKTTEREDANYQRDFH